MALSCGSDSALEAHRYLASVMPEPKLGHGPQLRERLKWKWAGATRRAE